MEQEVPEDIMQNSTGSVIVNAEAFNPRQGCACITPSQTKLWCWQTLQSESRRYSCGEVLHAGPSYFKHSSHFCESLPIAYTSNYQQLQIWPCCWLSTN